LCVLWGRGYVIHPCVVLPVQIGKGNEEWLGRIGVAGFYEFSPHSQIQPRLETRLFIREGEISLRVCFPTIQRLELVPVCIHGKRLCKGSPRIGAQAVDHDGIFLKITGKRKLTIGIDTGNIVKVKGHIRYRRFVVNVLDFEMNILVHINRPGGKHLNRGQGEHTYQAEKT